jgi:hypothetical protein
MMKQPAENTNATPLEEKLSAERIVPSRQSEDEEQEIEAEARRLSGETAGKWTQEVWDRATAIVHNRKTSQSKA